MLNNLKVRLLVIAALVAVSVWFLWQHRITLGLDLRGGAHLALEIDDPVGTLADEDRTRLTEQALQIIRTRIDEFGVAEPVVQQVGDDRIIVELPGVQDVNRAKEVIQRTAFLQFQIVRPLDELQPVLPRMDRALVNALGEEAVAEQEPAAPAVGDLFETPADTAAGAGADTVESAATAAQPLTSKLLPSGSEGQIYVANEDVPAVERYLALPEVQRLLPRGTELLWGFPPTAAEGEAAPAYLPLYLVEDRPIMTGEFLQDAQAMRDPQFGQPVVTFELNRRGGRRFEQGTGEHIGDLMAIVLDDRVYSAPVIRSQIGARGQIELGGAAIEEARDLALVLRAGALPAPIRIIEERTVGPSLGADSIEKGEVAGLIGIALVVAIMVLYYKLSGVMAVGALIIYVLLVLGGLAWLDAALTLPGIAGLILSIGDGGGRERADL